MSVASTLAGLSAAGPHRATSVIAAELELCGTPTPGAEPSRAQPTIEPIGFGMPLATPGLGLSLFRFTIPPQGVVAPHRHPGATILAIEAGAMTYDLIKGDAQITRSTTGGETLLPGQTAILLPGDSLFYDQETVHRASNDREETLVVLSVTLMAMDQPGSIATDDAGVDLTPSPSVT